MAGAVGEQAVRVTGLRDLQRAFARADKAVKEDLRDALMEAAQPVRMAAQHLAAAKIRNITEASPWSRMRVGVATNAIVYVAPVERGIKSRGLGHRRRPNLAPLLMERALEPALEQNRSLVERRLEHMLDEVADVWERR